MRVFINAILVHTFLNIYVFWRGWKILPKKNIYRIPFVAVFIVELIVYLIGFVYVDELSVETLHPIMKVGTSWMVFLIYMTGFLLVYDCVNFASRWIKKIPQIVDLHSLKVRRIYYVSAIFVVSLMMFRGSYNFWHPTVNELDITVDKTAKIDKLKIVMVADLHVGHLINKEILQMYVDRIMEQKPDLILLVGDIIDYDLYPVEKDKMEEEFQQLKAPYGVFAVTGNHEYRQNAEEKIKWLSEKAKLTVLRDSVIKIEDAFYIVGRDDRKIATRKHINTLMENVDRTYPVIVMNHQPFDLQDEANAGADLAVFGHTHGGQLFPYNFVIDVLYEVGHGYKKKDNTHIYVTSGLGLSGPQYRIGTLSEIVVINMQMRK